MDESEKEEKFTAFTGTAVRLDGKPLKATQQIAVEETSSSSSSSSSSASSSSSHSWGEGVGTIKAGNTAAAERRAAMLAAAESRNASSSSSLSSASSLTTKESPNKTKPAGPTKWSKNAKIGRFQSGGNRYYFYLQYSYVQIFFL